MIAALARLLPGRLRLQRMVTVTTAVLLVALATSRLTEGHGFTDWVRAAGVAVAGLLAVKRAPFPVVIVAAAAITANLRLTGVR